MKGGKKRKNLTGIEQVSALCLQDTDVLVWECSPLQGFVFLFSFQLIILLNPPHWEITSWEEADGIQSMKWWQDWATYAWTLEDLLLLLTGRQLHRSFPDSFIHFFFFNSISMFVTVSQNSNEGDVFSALRRISVHKLKAIIKIIKDGLCWEIAESDEYNLTPQWLMQRPQQ